MGPKKEFEVLLKKMHTLVQKHGDEIKQHIIATMPTIKDDLISIFSDLQENFEKYTEAPERQRIFDVIVEVMTENLPITKISAAKALDCILNEASGDEVQREIALIKSWLIQVKVRYERLPNKEYQATTTIFFDAKAPKKSTNTASVNRSDLPSEVREKFLTSGESELSVVIYQMGGE